MADKMKNKIAFSQKEILLTGLLFFNYLFFFSQPNQWVWKHGSNTVNQPGIYGTLGIAAPLNTPGARYESAQWTDLQGNFWLYGGGTGFTRYSDLWKYNPTTNMWTWMHGSSATNQLPVYGTQGIAAPLNTPGGCGFGAATWTDLNGNLWLYGGDDGANPYNNLWKYDITINQWTWMHGNAIAFTLPVYGTQNVSSPLNTPGCRVETSCTWTDNSGNLWLFGGALSGPGSCYNDLWKYTIATNQWTWIKGANTFNQPGTYGIQGLSAPANTPGARWCYASWKDNNGNLWLFGGVEAASIVGMNYFNDLWKFDITTSQWTWMKGSNLPNQTGVYGNKCIGALNNTPGSRRETRSCWKDDCGNFWLFGGEDLNAAGYNDLWKYDVVANQWIWISGSNSPNQNGVYGTINIASPANIPGSRMGAVSWKNNNGLWLFGGLSATGENNDLWKYVPDSISASFINSSLTGCAPLSVSFTNTSLQNCSSINSYQWNFGDPTSGNNNTSVLLNPSHLFNSPGIYTVNLIITDCIGLKDTAKTIVNVSSGVTFSIISNVGCAVQASVAIINNPGPFYTFLWQPGGIITPSITNQPQGNYTVTVTNTVTGCAATQTVSIIPNPNLPNITIVSPPPLTCTNTSVVLQGSSTTPSVNYQWIAGPLSQNYTVNATGIYTLVVTEQSTGCSSNATVTVVQLPILHLVASASSICFSSTVSSATAVAANGIGPYTYLWNDANNQSTPTATALPLGTYVVIVTDQGTGCVKSKIVTVSQLPQLTVTIQTTNSSVCQRQSITLNALTNSNPPLTYSWSNNQITNPLQTAIISNTNFFVTVTDKNGCSGSASIFITALPQPDINFSASKLSGCEPLCVAFTATSQTGIYYNWNFGSNNGSNTISPTKCFNAGNYNVSLTVTASNGCSTIKTINDYIHVYPQPIASFIAFPNPATMLEPLVNFTNTSIGASNYYWDFGLPGQAIYSYQLNPSYNYSNSGSYLVALVATNNYGCADTAFSYVEIEEDHTLYIPNAFTPDENGLNETWGPHGTGISNKDYELQVFNRWGQQIFSSNTFEDRWNGTYKGVIVKEDVYAYKLQLKFNKESKIRFFAGHVTVLK